MKFKHRLILILFTASIGVLSLSCQNKNRFANQYFNQVYLPVQITQSLNDPVPEEFFILDVPWYCYQNNNCQAVSLQMIAEKNGITLPIDYFNFLIGNTYGAMYTKGAGTFFPNCDPEPGLIVAAQYLGLSRKYMYTDDQDLFLKTLRYYISQGLPVRIPWNAAPAMKYAIHSGYFESSTDWKEPSKSSFTPHSIVFIGYDSLSFYYYETIANKKFVIHGQKGIRIPDQVVLEAINSLSSKYRLPWKYMFTVFSKDTPKTSLEKVWERNGTELMGNEFGPTYTGSLGLAAFSDAIRKEGIKMNNPIKKNALLKITKTLHNDRLKNADFLKNVFSEVFEIKNAAEYLLESSNNFKEIEILLDNPELDEIFINRISALFKKSADYERKAGDIFQTISKMGYDFNK
jgi:hypothetical protein